MVLRQVIFLSCKISDFANPKVKIFLCLTQKSFSELLHLVLNYLNQMLKQGMIWSNRRGRRGLRKVRKNNYLIQTLYIAMMPLSSLRSFYLTPTPLS
jgi:hypothetical protein